MRATLRDLTGHDIPGGLINPQMNFAPHPAPGCAMGVDLPFALPIDLHAGLAYHESRDGLKALIKPGA